MPYGFVGHWSHDPATGLVVLNGLIITNGSPKIGMNVLFSLRLSEDVILRDERYDLMRRQGVSFIAQGPMLPNPLDLRDTPTRKGSLAFPTTFAAERQAAEDSEQLRRATLVAFDLASEKRREYKLAELLQDRNP